MSKALLQLARRNVVRSFGSLDTTLDTTADSHLRRARSTATVVEEVPKWA